jgi:hypothetical protein
MAVGFEYVVFLCLRWGALEDPVAQRSKASDSLQYDKVSADTIDSKTVRSLPITVLLTVRSIGTLSYSPYFPRKLFCNSTFEAFLIRLRSQ